MRNLRSLIHALAICFVSASVALSADVAPGVVAGYSDQPISRVLSDIGALTRTTVTVKGDMSVLQERVTVVFNGENASDAVHKALKNLSYLIVDNGTAGISIELFGEGGQGSAAFLPDQEADLTTWDSSVKELEQLEQSAVLHRELTPDEIEVVPPSSPGARGITLAQLKEFEAQRSPIPEDRLEIVPSSVTGDAGVTLKQFNEFQSMRRTAGVSRMEVLPPADGATSGVTEADVEAVLRSREMPDGPPPLPILLPDNAVEN